MTQIHLYRIPELRYDRNIMLNFPDGSGQRENFFNTQTSLPVDIKPLQNPWKLTNNFTAGFGVSQIHYNYAKYTHYDQDYYYYITNAEVLSTGGVNYSLRLDPLMTYLSTPDDQSIITSRKHLVNREHKNRFLKDGNNYYPIFNRTAEPLDFTPQIEVSNTNHRQVVEYPNAHLGRARLALTQTDTGTQAIYRWRLYTEFSGQLLNTNTKPLYIPVGPGFSHNGNIKIITTNGDGYVTLSPGTDPVYFKIIRINEALLGGLKINTIIAINRLTGKAMTNPISDYIVTSQSNLGTSLYEVDSAIQVSSDYTLAFSSVGNYNVRTSSNNEITTLSVSEDWERAQRWDVQQPYAQSWTNIAPETFDFLELGDSANSKVIELPFVPVGDWQRGGNAVYIPVTYDFGNINLSLDAQKLFYPVIPYDTSFVDKPRVRYNDPKLMTSQFNPIFLRWFDDLTILKNEDANVLFLDEGYNFRLRLDNSSYSSARVDFQSYSNYSDREINGLRKVINLNNEVALISSDLDNYNRYQRDHDLKQLNFQRTTIDRQRTQAVFNQAVGMIPTSKLDEASGVSQYGVRAVRGVFNIYNEIRNSKQQLKELEANQKQKLLELRAGQINISGSTVTLNRLNADDKIRTTRFELPSLDKNYVDEFFHRYGYQTMEIKEPVLRTRKYFDYKEIVLDRVDPSYIIVDEVMADIKNSFANGITILHGHSVSPVTFDWLQTKENWEVTP